jgi:formylmethanofuran dehydrogenase subunit D
VSEVLTLITARTRKQAIGLHKGKSSDEYRAATGIVEMNPDDMARLGVLDGGRATLRTAEGEVELVAHAGTVPSGLVFVPLGTAVNVLIGVDTQGTGMPPFKGVMVDVGPVATEGAGS